MSHLLKIQSLERKADFQVKIFQLRKPRKKSMGYAERC